MPFEIAILSLWFELSFRSREAVGWTISTQKSKLIMSKSNSFHTIPCMYSNHDRFVSSGHIEF